MRRINTTSEKITSFDEESFRIYMKEINAYPVMTPEEEYKVGMEAKSGNERALEYLIKSNLRFVISVAKQYVDTNNKLPDLVNQGNLGLITAAQRFDPTKGFKFISYAVWWIRRSIQDYKTSTSPLIRRPTNRISALNKYRETKSMLEGILEREPSKDEIIDAMDNIPNLDLVASLDLEEILSLDKTIGEDGFSLKDVIITKNDIQSKQDKDYLQIKMGGFLSQLKPKSRVVIELSYGLTSAKPMTLQEIGDVMDLTREAVRQIKTKALFKLKSYARRNSINLNDFL